MSTATEAMDLSFEQALAELDQTVRRLESGETSLEEAMALFKRGTELSAYCDRKLAEAQTAITQLVEDGEGGQTEVPFRHQTDRADVSAGQLPFDI